MAGSAFSLDQCPVSIKGQAQRIAIICRREMAFTGLRVVDHFSGVSGEELWKVVASH